MGSRLLLAYRNAMDVYTRQVYNICKNSKFFRAAPEPAPRHAYLYSCRILVFNTYHSSQLMPAELWCTCTTSPHDYAFHPPLSPTLMHTDLVHPPLRAPLPLLHPIHACYSLALLY